MDFPHRPLIGTILVPFWVGFDQNCFELVGFSSRHGPTMAASDVAAPGDAVRLAPPGAGIPDAHQVPEPRVPGGEGQWGCQKNGHFHGEYDGKIMKSWCSLVSTAHIQRRTGEEYLQLEECGHGRGILFQHCLGQEIH
jgi:hypothetical protein